MFGRITRAWRRMGVGMLVLAAFMALGWATGIGELPEDVASLNGVGDYVLFGVVSAIVLFLVVALPIALLAALLPGLLAAVDLLLVTLLLNIPITLAMAPFDPPGWVYWIALGLTYFATSKVFYGNWLGRVWVRDSATSRFMFEAPEPPETVWARLAPLPEHEASFYWPEAKFRPAPEGSDADFLLIAPRRRGFEGADALNWIEAHEPGRHLTLRSDLTAKHSPFGERIALTLTPVGPRTRVEVEITFIDASVFHRFRLWLNNDAAEFAASLKNHAWGRKDRSIHGRQALPARNTQPV